MRLNKQLYSLVFACTLTALSFAVEKASKPEQAESEAEEIIKTYRAADGLKIELYAAEPMVAHPVAICTDERGRIFVAEAHRLTDPDKPAGRRDQGDLDMRAYMDMLDEDIAARTVEDRINMLKKNLKERAQDFVGVSEIVRLIEDRNGDGKADYASIFAEGFDQMEDGLAAGVLARKGTLWFTDIPNLWMLRDTKNQGKADFRKVLSTGYGVRIAFLGHDLHGLIIGPDGKLYFSIGDRGYNVTADGRNHANNENGAVFRCNQDGTDLEVIATGMRNPQELAFDQYGNLFTGDNNCDKGDPCRLVWVLEGGDSGWRIGYQHIVEPNITGPWHAEKLWSTHSPDQAPYVLPPIGHVTLAGPSGFAYYPGTGLPDNYNDHFLICDYRGVKGQILSFALKPKGAAFEVVDQQNFVSDIQITDVMFGVDGRVYASAWWGPISKTGKGRIYAISAPDVAKDSIVLETKKLIGEGMDHRKPAELTRLLAHRDQRVRQEAQFALAERGAAAELTEVLQTSTHQLARLHAIWGLGQIARERKSEAPLDPVLAALSDADTEVRVQAAKVLGECRCMKACESLLALLKTGTPRARLIAAMSLGKLGESKALAPVVEMLRENADKDAYLRHAGVMALTWISKKNSAALLEFANDESAAVRLGVLLALRRLQDPQIAKFLSDPEPKLVLEAARAINDVPIDAAMPQLAALIEKDVWKQFSPGELFAVERIEPAKPDEKKLSDAQKPGDSSKSADTPKPADHPGAANAAAAKADPAAAKSRSNEKDKDAKKTAQVFNPNASYVKSAEYVFWKNDPRTLKLSGTLPILQSGEYSLWISGSHVSELWLSTDDKPDNKRLIALCKSRTDPQGWTKMPEQQSYPVTLTAGKRYYFEALVRTGEKDPVVEMKPAAAPDAAAEKKPGLASTKKPEEKKKWVDTRDHVAVGWKLPNGRMQRPISEVGCDDQKALLRRVLNANFRLGGKKEALALAEFAADPQFAAPLRAEALTLLASWGEPSPKDTIVNLWRPLQKRDASVAVFSILGDIHTLLEDKSEAIQIAAARLAGKLSIRTVGVALYDLSANPKRGLQPRLEALKALGAMKEGNLLPAIKKALESNQSRLRQEALNLLAEFNPSIALPLLGATLEKPDIAEKQNALAILARMKVPTADALIAEWMSRLMAGRVEPEIQLDILEAAKASTDPAAKELLAKYQRTLPPDDELAQFNICRNGGNIDQGRKIFYENAAAQCIRCHKINGNGGDVGPELKGIASQKDRAYILQALVAPSAQIAAGYETVFVRLVDGRVLTGTVKKEDDVELTLVGADAKLATVSKDQIKTRRSQKISTMPVMSEVLTKIEIRNLVEYLSNLK